MQGGHMRAGLLGCPHSQCCSSRMAIVVNCGRQADCLTEAATLRGTRNARLRIEAANATGCEA